LLDDAAGGRVYHGGMKTTTKERVFDPHETARADALAGVPLATFRQRFNAYAIDFLLVTVTYVPLEILRQYIVLRVKHAPPDIHVHLDFHNPGSLVWIVLYFGLSVWWTNGQTVGKRLLRIRVVSLVHPKITLWQAMERALGYGASALEGGFGFLQYFLHHNRCCVHDRIAETIVIKEPT